MKIRTNGFIISVDDTYVGGFKSGEAFVKAMLDALKNESSAGPEVGQALEKAYNMLKPPAPAKKEK